MAMATAMAAFGLMAAGCGAGSETDENSAAAPSASAAETGPQLDPAVFEGDAQIIDGDRFELGELAGKDLVLWFWAPW